MAAPILLADDNAHARRMGTAYLEGLGHAVITACDGAAALDALAALEAQGQQPVLVLVDAALPGLEGRELAGRIKARPGGASVPVLILTGALSPTGGDWAPADGVLRKPLSSAGLEQRLRTLASARPPTAGEMLELAVVAAARS